MNQIPWKVVNHFQFDTNGDFVVILDYKKYILLKKDLEDLQLIYRTRTYSNHTEINHFSSVTHPKITYEHIDPKFEEMTDELVMYISLLDI